MKSPARYSSAVALPRPPTVTDLAARSGAASSVTTEARGGLVWVKGPDGIEQPCASPRVAALVAASVRNLGAA